MGSAYHTKAVLSQSPGGVAFVCVGGGLSSLGQLQTVLGHLQQYF